jgi:L-asparaginase
MRVERFVQTGVATALAVLLLGGATPAAALAGGDAAESSSRPAGLPVEPGDSKPEVAVIGMGGTIAGEADSRVGFETYQAGKLPVATLIKDLEPEVDDVAETASQDYARKSSGEFTLADYAAVALLVEAKLRTSDAVVLTSGTTSLEELAYFLDLTVRSQKPVVVTGAMRPWNVIGSDGPPNLFNAVRLAASARTRCFGTVVMMNDQIFPARDVTKTDTLRLNTFQTREFGDLGTVDQKEIRIQRAPSRAQDCNRPAAWRTPFDLTRMSSGPLPRVEIVPTYVDAGPESVTAFAASRVAGLVFAGTPAPAQMRAGMDAGKKGVVLVAANGYGAGAVHVDPGIGVVGAGDLSAKKARILLLLALSQTRDVGQINDWFSTYGAAKVGDVGHRRR